MPSEPPKSIGGEYGEIRANIDVEKLNSYLATNVKSIDAPVEVKQFKYGQSNPTYFLTDARKKRFVLRKKPAGQLISKTAHQVEREYTVLSCIHKYNIRPSTPLSKRVPVPEPIILCEDTSVVGTPFYIMEFLEGRIFTDSRLLEVSAKDRKECWISAVQALASLGSINPDEIGLSEFSSHNPYFPRQIKSMSAVSKAQAAVVDVESKEPTGDVPYFNEMIDWYKKNFPDEAKLGTRIVHGDYKMDNLVFHPTENRVIGILDWELCTLGSPLADLGNMTLPWSIDLKDVPQNEYTEKASIIRGFKGPTATDVPIALEDMEREYCRLMNLSYPMKEMIFVRSWMLFRLAIIAQGIAARYARRQASSEMAFIQTIVFPVIGNLAKLVLEDEGIRVEPHAKL